VLVLTRFRVADPDAFRDRVESALSVLGGRDGFVGADVVRSLDEPELWALVTRWRDVGSYRRAIGDFESRVVVVPLLAEALDEPSAFEDPDLL
jgi:Antibiotic biosynthesis monooxygenase